MMDVAQKYKIPAEVMANVNEGSPCAPWRG